MTLRRLPVENWIGYLSPYIIFGLEHRCLGKNLFDLPKNLFQQYRSLAAGQPTTAVSALPPKAGMACSNIRPPRRVRIPAMSSVNFRPKKRVLSTEKVSTRFDLKRFPDALLS